MDYYRLAQTFRDVKRSLSYSGDFEKKFIAACNSGTFNKILAGDIMEYYIKKEIKCDLLSDGIVIIDCPHKVMVNDSGGRSLYIYRFNGAFIYPVNENINYGISAYNSMNGWWQVVGNTLNDCIVKPEYMKDSEII